MKIEMSYDDGHSRNAAAGVYSRQPCTAGPHAIPPHGIMRRRLRIMVKAGLRQHGRLRNQA